MRLSRAKLSDDIDDTECNTKETAKLLSRHIVDTKL
jgi:hypothetical protein